MGTVIAFSPHQLDPPPPLRSTKCSAADRRALKTPHHLPDVVNRPKKSLQPLVLVVQDCLLRARSLCSVNPIVRWRTGGLSAVVSTSLIAASVCSFLIAAAAALGFSRGPNSISIKLLIVNILD
jgi:hypothetical protein